MSKAIQSIDLAKSTTGAVHGSASRHPEKDESGAFSRLLSTRQTETAGDGGGKAVPKSGNRLPDAQHKAGTDRAGEREQETKTTAAVAGQAVVQEQPADTPPPGPPDACTAGQRTELPDALQAGAGQADPVPDTAAPAGQEAATQEPAAALPATVAGDPGQSGPLIDASVAEAEADTAADTPDRPAAGTLPTAVYQDTNHARSASPADSIGLAVREGIKQMPVSQDTQGNNGQSLPNAHSGHTGSLDQPATGQGTGGAALFTDALLETAATAPSVRVQVPVGQPGWDRAVGDQVVWFVAQNIKSASLRLNPQHLGPLEMHLSMDGDKASIAFSAQHAVVRDALESSLPRLRDMFAGQGMTLVDVDVSQRDVAGRQEHAAGGYRNGTGSRTAALEESTPVPGSVPGSVTVHGMVDLYA